MQNTNFIDEKIDSELYLLRIASETEEENAETLFETVLKTYGTNSNTIAIQIEYADYLTFKKGNPEKAETMAKESDPGKDRRNDQETGRDIFRSLDAQ